MTAFGPLDLAFQAGPEKGSGRFIKMKFIPENDKTMKTGPLEKDIQDVLDIQVRPVLKAHNGDVELTGIEEGGVVHLRILGACATCMGAEQTVSDIIVASIRESCPWVSDVRVGAGVSDDLVQEALKFLKRPRG
jgi:Fe-S cluster biogenesis protein NfuA